MKAAVIYENGGPDVLRHEDVPDPECPDGCVLIDVEAISVEGGDLLHRAGSPPPSVPHVVGYLAAGTIVEVGAGVENRAVGDRVVTLNMAGSHASRRAVPAISTWPIPEGLDAARAACVPVAVGTAQECLFTAGNLEAGQTALIHAGAGGVGMAAIQLAKQAGATVISTASSDEKLERLKEFGLDHGINYATENFVERTRELTDGRGADVILDSVGGQNLVDSIGALAYRGTLVSVGVAGRAGSEHRGEGSVGAEQRAARCLPRRGAADRVPPRPRDDRRPTSSGSRTASCVSRSTARSRSPRPPPRTRTSRAARPSVAS